MHCAQVRRVAAAELRRQLHAEAPHGARALAGAPLAQDAVAMFDAAAAELWCARTDLFSVSEASNA